MLISQLTPVLTVMKQTFAFSNLIMYEDIRYLLYRACLRKVAIGLLLKPKSPSARFVVPIAIVLKLLSATVIGGELKNMGKHMSTFHHDDPSDNDQVQIIDLDAKTVLFFWQILLVWSGLPMIPATEHCTRPTIVDSTLHYSLAFFSQPPQNPISLIVSRS